MNNTFVQDRQNMPDRRISIDLPALATAPPVNISSSIAVAWPRDSPNGICYIALRTPSTNENISFTRTGSAVVK